MKVIKEIKEVFNRDDVKKRFFEILGEKSEAFIMSVYNSISANPGLQKCSPESLMIAAANAATLDLPIDPNLGYSYIIPYGGKAQFQIGYKGYKQLAMRTGQFLVIHATDVKEGEIISNNRLTGQIVFNWMSDSERKGIETVGYVSYFKLTNGFESTFYMEKEDVLSHAKKYSSSFKRNEGVWIEDFLKMARKTVTKLNLSQNAPLTAQIQFAIKVDQSDGEGYPDNKKKTPQQINDEREQERILEFINNADTVEQLEEIDVFVPDELKDIYKSKIKELCEKK
jgi:recombination protein RecT